ncbi:MAG TPA: hypothetical protein VL995_01220 [Cellvibrio sp.]|nr:hypothetical protein [Cellvibrio sp.]
MDINKLMKLVKIESFLEEIEDKLSRSLSAEKILNYLLERNVNIDNMEQVAASLKTEFLDQFPFVYKKIVCAETLLPSEVPIEISKKKYRVKGEVWVVHKNDVDPFPSSPHAHNYDQNFVMHLGNGKIYRNREYVTTAKKKQFLALREQIDNVTLPPLEIYSSQSNQTDGF